MKGPRERPGSEQVEQPRLREARSADEKGAGEGGVLLIDAVPRPVLRDVRQAAGYRTEVRLGLEHASRRLQSAARWVADREGPVRLVLVADGEIAASGAVERLPVEDVTALSLDAAEGLRHRAAAFDLVVLVQGGSTRAGSFRAERLALAVPARRRVLLEPETVASYRASWETNWAELSRFLAGAGTEVPLAATDLGWGAVLRGHAHDLVFDHGAWLVARANALVFYGVLVVAGICAWLLRSLGRRRARPVEEVSLFDRYLGGYGYTPAYCYVKALEGILVGRHRPSERGEAAPSRGRTLEVGIEDSVTSRLHFGRGAIDVGVEYVPYAFDRDNRARGVFESLACGDGRCLPFADRSFSCYYLVHILDHVADGPAMLREAWRVLEPGGLLVLSSFSGQARLPASSVFAWTMARLGFRRAALRYVAWRNRLFERIALSHNLHDRAEWEALLGRQGFDLVEYAEFCSNRVTPWVNLLFLLEILGARDVLRGLAPGGWARRVLDASVRSLLLDSFLDDLAASARDGGSNNFLVAVRRESAPEVGGPAGERPADRPRPLARSAVQVCEAKDPIGREIFLDAADAVYFDDPSYVPLLRSDLRRRLDPLGAFAEHGRMQLFVALRHGWPVGRIAAITNRIHDEAGEGETGFFGFFETIADEEVAACLLDAARSWARSQGKTRMVGPVSPSTNEESGVLVEGFDRPPRVGTPYNPPYYGPLLEALGLEKETDQYGYLWTREMAISPRLERIARKALADPEVTIRPVRRERLAAELAVIGEVYNESFRDNRGFVPMTEAELAAAGEDFAHVAEVRLNFLAFVGGDPAAFSLTLPDVNVILKKAGGRLLPFGWIHFVGMHARIRRARFVVLGVKPRYRTRGLAPAIVYETMRAGLALGYEDAELSVVLEDNTAMRRLLETLGYPRVKTWRLYRTRC